VTPFVVVAATGWGAGLAAAGAGYQVKPLTARGPPADAVPSGWLPYRRLVTSADQARAQATCCAALVDELVAHGVRHAVVAPGSRSTPLALALVGRPELTVHIVHDERAAAFVALGIGLGGTPAVVLCTSGTAAANFHPAVVEAGLSGVPMIVATADRPPELREVGAPQSIDQTHLYGRAVRWFHDPGVADAAAAPVWRSLGARAMAAAATGPVHLNLPFREPLVAEPDELPPRRRVVGAVPAASAGDVPDGVVAVARRPRGLVLAGASGASRAQLEPFVAATGWPLLADPVSHRRDVPGAIAAYDAMLRHAGFAAALPDVVVRVGRPASSKVLAQWVAASGAPVVQVGGPGVIDPDHAVAALVDAAVLPILARALVGVGEASWAARWHAAAERAEGAIDRALGPEAPLSEPAVARLVAAARPSGGHLVVAASMPMRDVEWFGGPGAVAHANRGANGIDGVVSTALGVALGAAAPTLVLVGDIAFVHDSGALTGLAARDADLRIVVVDNDGGGIFSFLPQATELPPERFERLFGTPHGTDVVALAAAHGLDAATVTTATELRARLARRGPSVTRVRTDRAENVRVHAALNAAVAAVLDG
jgi:2-succinyl-5-enolpyruvyl-6-hydroxy-3-cyclohexene-1-carboxylate synthase